MSACLRTALTESLSAHLGLGKSRPETLSMLLIGLIHSPTVKLTHIARQCHGPARYAPK
ncbi:hypothetical protein MKK63_04955 [Methylobacterium sp. J-088]|uniref:hypothetical protein n=1 Tax=Methylobacterium sp. J-088 TaxID=2836664 RepID=UPI001FBB7AF4|nr:hypothetical protein [Methylobacterium sp. J-088]MCJ2062049.1 hypothetical protein [Methylobacterium sp. J-088]